MKEPDIDLRELRARSDEAFTKRRLWDPLLNDIHRFVMPWLKQDGIPGHTDHLFDSTAVHSALRFGGRLQGDVLPPGQKFWDLAAGPLIEQEAQRARTNSDLQTVSRMAYALLQGSNFDVASGELCVSLAQGTAAMLCLESDKRLQFGWQTVPIQELAFAEGPFGDVEGIYWKRKWRASHLPRLFPGVTFPSALQERITRQGADNDWIEIRQDTEWNDDARRWVMVAYSDIDKHETIRVKSWRKSRWIVPRFLKMPGEVMGRGPAMLALPNAKTLNTTMELMLKSAALALFGVYMWRDDGVFDPDSAHNRPGAMWKVGMTGGVMGPPLQPLETNRQFDISGIVLKDQREQTKLALYDEIMPEMGDSVRSPTEIVERLKRSYRDHAASAGRLTRELVKPVVECVIDIMEERGLLPTRIDIDQLGIALQLTSPLARAQKLEEVQRIIEGVNILRMTVGEQAAQIFVEEEQIGPEILRNLGWEERSIRAEDKRKAMKQQIGNLAGMQIGAEMAKAMPTQQAAPAQLRAVA
jgi:hypothetical protein